MPTYKTFKPINYNTYTKLCELYQVDYRTLKIWLPSFLIRSQENSKRKLTLDEIESIVWHLGLPFATEDEKLLKGFDFYRYNTISALAEYYEVDRRTFAKWLIPVREEIIINHEDRRKLFPSELRQIIKHLGFPDKSKDRKEKENTFSNSSEITEAESKVSVPNRSKTKRRPSLLKYIKRFL